MPKPSKSSHRNKSAVDLPPPESDTDSGKRATALRACGMITVAVISIAVLIQLFIASMEYKDPRAAAFAQAVKDLNITSTGPARSVVPATATVGFVAGPSASGVVVSPKTKAAAGQIPRGVLGVKHRVKRGEVVLSFPPGAYVDPGLLLIAEDSFLKEVFENPELKNPSEDKGGLVPQQLFVLSTWALMERRRGGQSPHRAWLGAGGSIDLSRDEDSGGALFWPDAVGASGCVSKEFSHEFNETRFFLAEKTREQLELVCADEEHLKKNFAEEYNLLCGTSAGGMPSLEEVRLALNVVVRRGLLNQALVPFLDLLEPVNAESVNVGLRLDQSTRSLQLIAGADIEKGTPLMFQLFKGRNDALLRTGIDYKDTLFFEWQLARKAADPEDKLVKQLCLDAQGSMVLSNDGLPTSAIMQCVATFAATKKQRRRMEKNLATNPQLAAQLLQKDAALRRHVAGNMSMAAKRSVQSLSEGAANSDEPACEAFEPFRSAKFEVFRNAAAYFDEIVEKSQ